MLMGSIPPISLIFLQICKPAFSCSGRLDPSSIPSEKIPFNKPINLNGRVKLVGGRYSWNIHGGGSIAEGNVFVESTDDSFYPVCDDGWGMEEAAVVCRQLGFTDGEHKTNSRYGPVGFRFAMDDVVCLGNESRLQSCRSPVWENCGPNDGAGVYCTDFPVTKPLKVNGTVKLVGGSSNTEGNVYVESTDGEFYPVCDDGWGVEEAAVVCSQLGYSSAHTYTTASRFGRVGPYFAMDNVICSGKESTLQSCMHSKTENCVGSEGAGVFCIDFPKPLKVNGTVKLVGGSSNTEGNVYVESTDGKFYPVCDSGWGMEEATVVCRQLGYRYVYYSTYSEYGPVNSSFAMDAVVCSGNESRLQSCVHSKTENCGYHNAAGVYCIDVTKPLKVNGTVKLVGGSSNTQGNVYVESTDGEFYPVCDDGWGEEQATVVCRQLGYGYDTYTTNSRFGRVSSSFAMDDVVCSGSESTLQSCESSNGENCWYSEGAGVFCIDPNASSTFSCGIANSNRIVGGEDALKNEFPWQVGILTFTSNIPFCGGTIISSLDILTAAHCVKYRSPTSIRVRIKDHDTQVLDGEKYMYPCKIITHQFYDSTRIDYDYAIIQLCDRLSFSSTIRPACLPTNTSDHVFENSAAIATGWGRLSTFGPISSTLQKVELNTLSNAECCGSSYLWLCSQISPRMICAVAARKGICFGDSGGPLVVKDSSGFYTVVGSSSFVAINNCGTTLLPSVFARVTAQLSWIESNMADRSYTRGMPPTKVNGTVKLVGGSSNTEGNVYVESTDGEFYPVYDDGWGKEEAAVVCRQLGYIFSSYSTSSRFGPVDSIFAMGNVVCSGSELSLQSCETSSLLNCTSCQGAGVACIVSSSPLTPTCSCGMANNNRIVGGEDALKNEFPWQVGLVTSTGTNPFCGGTVISTMDILTAAHCVIGESPTDIRVAIKDHNIDVDDGEEYLTPCSIQMHEKYNDDSSDYDYAIIHLCDRLSFSSSIRPACLPTNTSASYYENKTAIATGWGKVSTYGSFPTTLQKVELKTMSNLECCSYPYNYYSCAGLTARMICAAGNRKDTCSGDSGGPLMVKESSGYYTIVGSTSFGAGCAQSNAPGVYARVTHQLSWIETNMVDNSCTSHGNVSTVSPPADDGTGTG